MAGKGTGRGSSSFAHLHIKHRPTSNYSANGGRGYSVPAALVPTTSALQRRRSAAALGTNTSLTVLE